MKVMLDNFEYSSKPCGKEIGLINNRIIQCNPVEVDAAKLAEEVTKGKTFIPATFKSIDGNIKRSKSHWESQQVIALDFDEGLTLEEAKNDTFFKQNAVFLYTTFSHKDYHHKFRVVFILDKLLTQYEDFEKIINNMLERYPQADRACRDGSRLFFGGKEVIPFNFNNRLEIASFAGLSLTPLQDIESNLYMSVTRVHTKPEASNSIVYANNLELIRNRDIKKLQEILNIEPVILSNNEVLDYLQKQDLRDLLGIRTKSNFIDIFHDEDNPSASIYQSRRKNGHWLYKCHSANNSFAGTILQLIQRLLECSVVEVKKFLMELYRINIYESEAVKEFKESIDIYKNLLQSDELEEVHPYFYKVFSKYGHLEDLYMLLDLAKEFITDETEPRILFYHGVRTLAEHFRRSPSATGARMNFFTLFLVVKKLDESEIPQKLLLSQKQHKRQNHFQYRSNTYELPMYTYEFFNQIDEMCSVWLEKGCTGRTISYEGIMRTYGREEADRVFPQDKGQKIKELNEEVVSYIHLQTTKMIQRKGWTTEKEILDAVELKFKGQQEFKTKQLKRCIAEMLDAYDLEIVSTNKKIKLEMNITEKDLGKSSFPRIIRKAHRELPLSISIEKNTQDNYKTSQFECHDFNELEQSNDSSQVNKTKILIDFPRMDIGDMQNNKVYEYFNNNNMKLFTPVFNAGQVEKGIIDIAPMNYVLTRAMKDTKDNWRKQGFGEIMNVQGSLEKIYQTSLKPLAVVRRGIELCVDNGYFKLDANDKRIFVLTEKCFNEKLIS